MLQSGESVARWVIQGMASGESMRIDLALCVLNEIYRLDPDAAEKLVSTRFECNENIINHPTIVCDNGKVGMLGVINGILGKEDPCGSGVAVIRDVETKKIQGFQLYQFDLPNNLERWA